ncbi:hypothetical protein EVAR_65995_1 [Eumeta japonica]|uniref:Uncharacterized protein n=1 Tax=Eumeta variegata TaxID=151549 RepID=A0A4C1ZMZ8_EUMVA|nr:hypothetical protein EVAR_65995_1 [Eumeta japonica]
MRSDNGFSPSATSVRDRQQRDTCRCDKKISNSSLTSFDVKESLEKLLRIHGNPRGVTILGQHAQPGGHQEGDDVYFECAVRASPVNTASPGTTT